MRADQSGEVGGAEAFGGEELDEVGAAGVALWEDAESVGDCAVFAADLYGDGRTAGAGLDCVCCSWC